MTSYGIILTAIYLIYVSIESCAGIARYGGYKVGAVSIGVSLQNQMLSLNRFLGFLIAPMVGYFADAGGTADEIFLIGMIGSLCGGIGLIVVYIQWNNIANIFARIAVSFMHYGYGFKGFQMAFRNSQIYSAGDLGDLRWNYLLAQFITTGLAMPAVFALNILALKFPMYQSTLVQMTGVISGLGNLVLNFYTYPHLAVQEVRGGPDDCYRSIFLGKVLGMLLLSPIVIGTSAFL